MPIVGAVRQTAPRSNSALARVAGQGSCCC